jgi:autophagy-related protein 18
MRDMKVIHIIRDIPSNPEGLCALSSNDNSPFLAYPGSAITGEIQIFDTINLVSKNCYFRFRRSIFYFV